MNEITEIICCIFKCLAWICAAPFIFCFGIVGITLLIGLLIVIVMALTDNL